MFPAILGSNFLKSLMGPLGVIAGIGLLVAVAWFLYNQQQKQYEDQIEDLNSQISTLNTEKNELEVDLTQALLSNENLSATLRVRERELEEAVKQLELTRQIDEESNRRRREFNARINNTSRMERLEAIRNSRKATLLVTIVNDDINCWVTNFDRRDGGCVNGEFVSETQEEGSPSE